MVRTIFTDHPNPLVEYILSGNDSISFIPSPYFTYLNLMLNDLQ